MSKRMPYFLSMLGVISALLGGMTLLEAHAFPDTPILDNFNRPNEGSPGGPNWIASLDPNFPGHLGITVQNNQAVGANTTFSHSSVWTTWYSEDQEAYFTYTGTPGTHACMGPSVRVKTPNDLASTQYLLFFCQETIGSNVSNANIWRRKNGQWTRLTHDNFYKDIHPGDQIGLRAIGNKIEGFLNGQVVTSVVDSNPVLGGGYLQLYVGDDVGHTADNFGGGNVSSEPPPSADPPGITSPQAGSVLSGATATFSWSDNGSSVSQWWLHIGTSQGALNIADTGGLSGSTLSEVVSGIPTNGGSVWVRLWYLSPNGWEYQDVQYTASNSGSGGGGSGGGSSGGPEILSPAPSAVLPGASSTFSWTTNGTTVHQWWLHVGTSQGALDLADTGSLGSSTSSTTISSLPTNGSSVWVRLWYLSSIGWEFKDVQYTASGSGGGGSGGGGSGPGMVSPAPSSVLPGSSVTFSWSANGVSGVNGWWLYVGTSKGSGNIRDTGGFGGSTFSTQVSGIPTNGSPVWVRLWWFVGSGHWQHIDVQYTAAP